MTSILLKTLWVVVVLRWGGVDLLLLALAPPRAGRRFLDMKLGQQTR